MDKAEIIKILQSEDWTKADALRAVESIDFSTNPDELTIRRNISSRFAGRELIKRQYAQRTQKGLVTQKTNQLELLKREYQAHIKQGKPPLERSKQQVIGADSPEQAQQIELMKQQYRVVIEQHDRQNQQLLVRVKELEVDNRSLTKVNAELKKDNKSLKNIVDSIRLQIAKDMKGILKNQDSDLRQAILKLFKSTQG
jgi:translation initiation factor 1 (eIF-1/SUI1)